MRKGGAGGKIGKKPLAWGKKPLAAKRGINNERPSKRVVSWEKSLFYAVAGPESQSKKAHTMKKWFAGKKTCGNHKKKKIICAGREKKRFPDWRPTPFSRKRGRISASRKKKKSRSSWRGKKKNESPFCSRGARRKEKGAHAGKNGGGGGGGAILWE